MIVSQTAPHEILEEWREPCGLWQLSQMTLLANAQWSRSIQSTQLAKTFQATPAYLTEIRDRTTVEKHSGQSVEQTIETVTSVSRDRAPDKARLVGGITTAYAEAP
jgi:hypothetical protein